MAKSGNVTGAGTASDLIALVAPVSPASDTLGGLALAAMDGKAANGIIVIDFGRRKLGVYDYSLLNMAAIAAVMEPLQSILFVPETPDKSSTLFNVVNIGGESLLTPLGDAPLPQSEIPVGVAINDLLGYGRSTLSPSSLINRVEDALSASNKEGILVFNQGDDTIQLWVTNDTGALTDVTVQFSDTSVTPAANRTPVATFTQTVEASATTGTGIFRH